MLKRTSPLNMGLKPERALERDGWEIALTYVGERTRSGLFVTDLSHVPKWSLHAPDLDEQKPAGLQMPARPGLMSVHRGIVLTRMSRWEARILVLGDEIPVFSQFGFTDVTEGWGALAVVGPRCFHVLSKLASLDMDAPAAPPAAMAPLEDVTCLLIRLESLSGAPGLIIAGARGYGHFLLDAVLDAGQEYGIETAGWKRFSDWMQDVRSGPE